MNQSSIHKQETLEELFLKLCIEVKEKIPQDQKNKRKKVIVISGPTGVGKSEMAMQLADKIGGEIISCDSMQIYRGMNIGTAKPPLEDQLNIPHHLIDICDLNEEFNVVSFYKEALFACQKVHERDNIPILVGGSGFYIHTFLYGPPSGPPPNKALREKLEKEMDKEGPEVMYQRLKCFDPEYAATITIHDRHKIVRAMEIIEQTHKKVSDISWKKKNRPLKFDFRCWFFNRPRESLYHRINKRCDKMVKRGLLQEINLLKKQGLLENRLARQSIGYKQGLS
ncbi:tRNA (adenosine(37)-N6)-dimethylallyltransferase MiaA, partial [Chlamydiales bacterium]|nr:tRNA (adenosine(37)-N6)-dimethylallyltransferase MiaA [Chlamydiales bacterium]